MNLDEIRARLTADASGLISGFKAAETAMNAFGLSWLKLAGYAAAGIGTLATMTKVASDQAQALDQLSQRTGLAKDSLQNLAVALARTDTSQESYAQGVRFLATHMNELQKEFAQFGITAGKPEVVMQRIADVVGNMPAGFEKTATAMRLLGRQGQQMIPLLNELANGGFEKAKQKAEELGAVLTSSQQRRLLEVNNAWSDLGTAIKAFSANVASFAAPAFTVVVDWLTKVVGLASKAAQDIATILDAPTQRNDNASKGTKDYLDKIQGQIDARQLAEFESFAQFGAIADNSNKATKAWSISMAQLIQALDRVGTGARESNPALEQLKGTLIRDLGIEQWQRLEAELFRVNTALLQVEEGWRIVDDAALKWRHFDQWFKAHSTVKQWEEYADAQRQMTQEMERTNSEASEQALIWRTLKDAFTDVQKLPKGVLGPVQPGQTFGEMEGFPTDTTAPQMIDEKDFAELRKRREMFAKAAFEDAERATTQFVAMDRAMMDLAEAYDRAAVASGRLSQVDMARRSGDRAVSQIDLEIKKENDLYQARLDHMNTQFAAAGNDLVRQQDLLTQYAAAYADHINRLAVLDKQRQTAVENRVAAVDAATRGEGQKDLAAQAAVADANVRIMQAMYADVEDLQAAAATAALAHKNAELANTQLTADQRLAVERNYQAQLIGIQKQYPTFFQKQMQDLVNSNTFALAQITTNFTNATAQWIVNGQQFSQFWNALQVTIVQAFLNSLVQMVAEFILKTTMMQNIATVFEAAKTAIFGEGEAARLAISKTTMATMGLMVLASLAQMAAFAEAAIAIASAIAAATYAVAMSIAGVYASIPFAQMVAVAIGTAAMNMLLFSAAAIGAAQAATQMALGAAVVAASTAGGLASGGIMTQPGIVSFAEDAPEAAIPLNERGAAFMSHMLGMSAANSAAGQEQTIHTHVYLDGREIAVATVDKQISALRQKGLPV